MDSPNLPQNEMEFIVVIVCVCVCVCVILWFMVNSLPVCDVLCNNMYVYTFIDHYHSNNRLVTKLLTRGPILKQHNAFPNLTIITTTTEETFHARRWIPWPPWVAAFVCAAEEVRDSPEHCTAAEQHFLSLAPYRLSPLATQGNMVMPPDSHHMPDADGTAGPSSTNTWVSAHGSWLLKIILVPVFQLKNDLKQWYSILAG